ncbi:FAD dependent oxidoreductase [Dissophora ornata]|nr:FAD dependent oxidoreductase [Dissophora ornata]
MRSFSSSTTSRSPAASTEKLSEYAVDHLVIGGGVVGLAVAERLAARGASTLLVDKNPAVGQETSSRNSEVIHAGLYYPVDSLKTKLCIRGNELMYDFCEKYNIEHRQTTKWVVGQNEADLEYLEGLSKKAQELLLPTKRMPGLPTFMLTQEQMLELEPNVQGKAAMVSSRTGIVDVHGLMGVLEARIQDHGGHVILQCEVTEIERIHPNVMTGRDADCDNGDLMVNAATVINSAGLYADRVYGLLRQSPRPLTPLPPFKLHYCKGHYYGYSGSALVSRLIYPVPDRNLAGLGTHLTLDLAGRMRFGPDVLYIGRLDDYSVDPCTVGSAASLETVSEVIGSYLPAVKASSLYADYAGIRPKLAGPGEPFHDFIIHHHGGFVNLAGIESPGLTSSLAIAEYVEGMLY